ncbi:MAG: aldo/keto reductase [Acidobacteriia bacterium]|nr:aldo/keto reductase [Terriglobia bacterium]
MPMTFSRRDALRWSGAASVATTFLPLSRYRAFVRPAGDKLQTRVLGRTGREVTTFGIGGVTCLVNPGDTPVALIVKAVKAGVTFLDTGNSYGASQRNYGAAFRALNLIPGQPGYQAALRSRLFVSTKTGMRYSIVRAGAPAAGPPGRGGSQSVLDELKQSMTEMFGDGEGSIPDGAYVDMMHVHNLNTETAVDAIFEGLANPGDPSLPRVGALACLVDYRDGTNLTGLNPEHKKWIRHIGMSCHENPSSVMYAMRKDKANIIEGLMCTINPNDPRYFSFQTNALPVAEAKNVGVIGMKLLADGVLYGKKPQYAGEWIKTVGQPGKVSYEDFLHYTLSARGVSAVVVGIGETDPNNDPERDQFVADLAACQTAGPLSPRERRDIEDRVAALHGTQTNFFQRPGSGLQPPQNVKVSRTGNGPVEVSWDTAYAGAEPIVSYEIFRREEMIARVPYAPQTSEEPFRFTDKGMTGSYPGGLWYRVGAVDARGGKADSMTVLAPSVRRAG